jgi:phosphatidylglycerophosphate synthase
LKLDLKERARAILTGPARALAGAGVSATHLTVTGFLLAVAAAVMLARGRYDWTAALLIVSGLCDTLDGAVARAGAGETRLGAFLDSTLDRAGESAVYVGSAWRGLVLVREWAGPRWDVTLPVLALASSLLVSYVRARAEGLGAECRVGLMERTERLVLLIAAALVAVFWEPAWAWALAALSALNFVTFAQRLVHVGRALR